MDTRSRHFRADQRQEVVFMSGQATAADLKSEEAPQALCRHHWLIEPPTGPTSKGRCKYCGEERYFINSISEWAREEQEAGTARDEGSS